MAKNKHNQKKNAKKEIIIREKTEPEHGDYYDDDTDIDLEAQDEEKKQRGKSSPKSFKFAVRLAVIAVLAVAALVFWFNRDHFAPENISNWFQTKLMGIGIGDGYPVQITGADVNVDGFSVMDGNSVVLSDTALTAVNSTGKEIFSVRHSFNEPAMRTGGDRYLVYGMGGTGFSIISAEKGEEKHTCENKITAADISETGKYAVATQPSDYSSKIEVFKKDGTLQFTYSFADGYVTALALNRDGTKGAAATVNGRGGKLYTKLYVFDFTVKDPVAEYMSDGNLVSRLYFGGDTVYAVGDVSTIVGRDAFSEYNYGGKQLTAVKCENGRAFVSVSSYSHAGASDLLIFKDSAEPRVIEAGERITDISSYGGTVSVLANHRVVSFDMASGNETGSCDAGYDGKGIAMINEGSLYVMGVREIRYVSLVKS